MIQSHVVFRVIVVSGLLVMIWLAKSAYLPILIAVASAFLLHPFVRILTRRIGIGHNIAILTAILVAMCVTVIMMGVIVRPIVKEIILLSENIPMILKSLVDIILAVIKLVNDNQLYTKELQSVVEEVLSGGMTAGVALAKKVASAAVSLLSEVIDFVLIPVLIFFLLKDYRLLADGVVSFVDTRYRQKARSIIGEIARVIGSFLRGQVLVCFIVGAVTFGGLLFFEVPYPFVLACVAGITEAIPIIGPILAAIPAILLGLIASPITALKIALFYLIVQQLENHIIVPKVMGDSVNLHPVLVIVGLLIAGELYGIGGMILALPVMATVRVLIKNFWWKEERGIYEHNDG